MNGTAKHIGTRRLTGWWEPTYNPALNGSLTTGDWKFNGTTGIKKAFLSADRFSANANEGEVEKFKNLTFEDCDIQGYFEHKPSILFDECRFHNCDFSFSEWRRATFRNCEFKKCSFALATFEECEFRDCRWQEIGMQGSKTDFIRTFITNPDDLVNAGFSGRQELHASPIRHALHQAYRLEGTKAHVARTLLYSHEEVGDDSTYYQVARLHDLQQLKAKIYHDIYRMAFGKSAFDRIAGLQIISHLLEILLLYVLGIINGWGATILRPILGLAVTFILFGLIYKNAIGLGAGPNYWQKSFDIATLAGYGNQTNLKQSESLRIVEGLQLVVSILFYTVFFSTALTRNSRTR